MQWIGKNSRLIMLLCGLVTCTTFYAALAPAAALQLMFGATLEGPLADILVRNWGLQIAVVGLLLITAAFHVPSRTLALTVAIVTKTGFVLLVLSYGRSYLPHALPAVLGDTIMTGLSLACLLCLRLKRKTDQAL
jgi:hypothetical protein